MRLPLEKEGLIDAFLTGGDLTEEPQKRKKE